MPSEIEVLCKVHDELSYFFNSDCFKKLTENTEFKSSQKILVEKISDMLYHELLNHFEKAKLGDPRRRIQAAPKKRKL